MLFSCAVDEEENVAAQAAHPRLPREASGDAKGQQRLLERKGKRVHSRGKSDALCNGVLLCCVVSHHRPMRPIRRKTTAACQGFDLREKLKASDSILRRIAPVLPGDLFLSFFSRDQRTMEYPFVLPVVDEASFGGTKLIGRQNQAEKSAPPRRQETAPQGFRGRPPRTGRDPCFYRGEGNFGFNRLEWRKTDFQGFSRYFSKPD